MNLECPIHSFGAGPAFFFYLLPVKTNLDLMKPNIFLVLMLALAVSFTACDSKKTEDSTEVAEDQNEAKHDDSKLEKDSKRAVEIADGGLY